jgi:acetylornithine deacetylase/succinyl-diaminopimelate desuccinylase-like protein
MRAVLPSLALLLAPLWILFPTVSPVAGTPRLSTPISQASSGRDAPLSEAARWLRGYLRIDTTNPPGGEAKATRYLASILHRYGIPTRTFYTAEGRASLYARLEADPDPAVAGDTGSRTARSAYASPGGTGSGGAGDGALLLLHHMDVVPPGPGWTVEPFAGTVADGRLWGRGAVDSKALGVAQLAAFVDLARSAAPRTRDVILLAVADEESGGTQGTAWLLEHHPELFDGVGAVLNEGGANLVLHGELAWWGIEIAQKRPLWIEVVASGRGGHGSGGHPWNATHRLIRALDGLLRMKLPWRVTAPVRTYLKALAPLHTGPLREVFSDPDAYIREEGPTKMLLPGLSTLFLDSVQVTVLEGSDRINVLPGEARAQVDIRLLPDTDAEAFLSRVRGALGNEVRVEVLLTAPPTEPSSTAHPVYRLLEEELGEEGPVVPAFIGGFTDSRFFRQRGIPAYGISPFVLEGEDLRGIHGVDERIPLRELDRGVDRVRRLVRTWALGRDPTP